MVYPVHITQSAYRVNIQEIEEEIKEKTADLHGVFLLPRF
jgi:glutathionylspermidine synthase